MFARNSEGRPSNNKSPSSRQAINKTRSAMRTPPGARPSLPQAMAAGTRYMSLILGCRGTWPGRAEYLHGDADRDDKPWWPNIPAACRQPVALRGVKGACKVKYSERRTYSQLYTGGVATGHIARAESMVNMWEQASDRFDTSTPSPNEIRSGLGASPSATKGGAVMDQLNGCVTIWLFCEAVTWEKIKLWA